MSATHHPGRTGNTRMRKEHWKVQRTSVRVCRRNRDLQSLRDILPWELFTILTDGYSAPHVKWYEEKRSRPFHSSPLSLPTTTTTTTCRPGLVIYLFFHPVPRRPPCPLPTPADFFPELIFPLLRAFVFYLVASELFSSSSHASTLSLSFVF